jgi:arylsulfatase
VAGLRAIYDQWWTAVEPMLINEDVAAPKMNPMKELYWKQFGGGPDEALLKRMDPNSSPGGEESEAPKKRKAGAAK